MGHPRTFTRRNFLLTTASLAAGAVLTKTTPGFAADAPGVYPTADPQATAQVRAMLQYLREQSGKSLISGQTDLGDAQWIKANTGKYPAILGVDFHRVPARIPKETDNIPVAIDWFRNKHGLVTAQWHWVARGADVGKGFNTRDSRDFDLSAVINNPDSDAYKSLLSDIDDVAAAIKKLADAKVPILFRPLHEAQGGWFWWGAKGAKPCVALYRLMFDRMTKHHGLHNIAWVWVAYPDSQKKGDPKQWYPGDDCVDVIASDYCEKKSEYDELVALTNGTKPVALAETMNAPDPDKALGAGIKWLYWVTWARRDWHKSSADDMKNAMANPRTISLDQMPNVATW